MQVHIIFTIWLLSFKIYLKSWKTTRSTSPNLIWDAKENLVKLESFKVDVTMLFDGPYHKMKNDETVSIVLNCLGMQTTQTIKLLNITPRTPKEICDALEIIFRPEPNDTIVKFRFWSMKQKQSQSVNAYLTDQRLMTPECNYHKDTLVTYCRINVYLVSLWKRFKVVYWVKLPQKIAQVNVYLEPEKSNLKLNKESYLVSKWM